MTVVVRITGGLGNQLFQYAMGRALAIRLGTDLLLEDSFYFDVPPGSTPRTFELDQYPLVARRATAEERARLKFYTGRVWRRLRRYARLPGPYRYVQEPTIGRRLDVDALEDNVFLDGYWQTERYFERVNDQLRAEIIPRQPPSSQDRVVLQQMQESVSVSLHVRRGDYVTNSAAAALHGVCGLEYYASAIRRMGELFQAPRFFVFSDDPEWVRAHLPIPFEHVHVEHNAHAPWQDLHLMAACKHHVLANSSFSWWGAWLNPSATKLVLRPRRWYAGEPAQGDWTCPPQWLAI